MKSAAKSMPLFRRAKRAELVTLTVRRYEDGRWIQVPNGVPAHELPDREAVRARFGGGQYDVIGRDGRKIAARSRFVIEGKPQPLGDAPLPSSAKRGKGETRFATPEGERQALVFGLLESGLSLVEIAQRTGIEARTLRAIYVEWLTPFDMPLPTTPEEVARLALARAAVLERRELAAWDDSSAHVLAGKRE